VILIVKENRTYDEVLGDETESVGRAADGSAAAGALRRRGYVDGRKQRLSLKDVEVTPNHHAIAETWSFSDNFYADSDVSVDGHHWLVGAYPNVWTETSLMAAYSDQKKDFRPVAARRAAGVRRARIPRCIPKIRRKAAPSGTISRATA
jgi:hypothetical protein